MQIVIDIDEDIYKARQHWVANSKRMVSEVDVAIANGTPFDKIRAEIQENINYNKKMNYQGIVAGLLLTLNIIDKYRNEVSP